MLMAVADHSNSGPGAAWYDTCNWIHAGNNILLNGTLFPSTMGPALPLSSRSPPLWFTCNAQVPEPRLNLGPQLVKAAMEDDAEKVGSLLDQGAPVDFGVRYIVCGGS